jgi:hypothetical protein
MIYQLARFVIRPDHKRRVYPHRDLKEKVAHHFPWLEGEGIEYNYFISTVMPTFRDLGFAVQVKGAGVDGRRTLGFLAKAYGPHF